MLATNEEKMEKHMNKNLISVFVLLCILFASCSNSVSESGHDDEDDIDKKIEKTEKQETPVKISRDQKEVKIELDQAYDLSDCVGKNIFLVYKNFSEETKNIMKDSSYNVSCKNEEQTKQYNKNKGYYNVPFYPPDNNQPLKKTTKLNFLKNILHSDNQENQTEVEYTLGTIKKFKCYNDDNSIVTETAELKIIGEHCRIWYVAKNEIFKNKTEDEIKGILQKIADIFERIYLKETYIFGSNIPKIQYDNIININEDTKIEIIVYDLFGDYEITKQNQGGTFGYFAPGNFYKSGNTLNKCQCLYIDSYFLEVAEENQYFTLAHEFQHLLNYVNKKLNNNEESDTWFNEMMSMVCEDIMQSQLQLEDEASPKNRLNCFNEAYNLGFTDWSNDLYSYANAYAFGAYLLRNYGIDFIRELAHNQYVDEEAITQALIKTGAKEKSFNEAFALFYNVVLNPEKSDYTLNKAVSQSYIINVNNVDFSCSAINLLNYIGVKKEEMTAGNCVNFYKGQKGKDYYGPIIWDNNYVFNELGPKGMGVTHINITSDSNFIKLKSSEVNNSVSYYLVIKD